MVAVITKMASCYSATHALNDIVRAMRIGGRTEMLLPDRHYTVPSTATYKVLIETENRKPALASSAEHERRNVDSFNS